MCKRKYGIGITCRQDEREQTKMVGYIMRRHKSEVVRKVMQMHIEERKNKWFDAIESDMRTANVCVNNVWNIQQIFNKWIINPKQLEERRRRRRRI